MKILITGANGQLGTELRKLLDERNTSYTATDSSELDITDEFAVSNFVAELNPDVVYHCAAFTAVDAAEDEAKELNRNVNVDGTKNVAIAAEAVGATIVYISTDYVFDGTSLEEYKTDDLPNPQNEYGKAKLEGERMVQKYSSKYYIVRTSWIFGEFGNNFVFTMLRLAEAHPRITVVDDQFGRPTWTRTLAEFMVFLIEKYPSCGIYHLANEGSCSWFEFSKKILRDSSVEVIPVDSTQYPQKAKRPKHSALNLDKTKDLGFSLISWQEALQQFEKSLA